MPTVQRQADCLSLEEAQVPEKIATRLAAWTLKYHRRLVLSVVI